MLICHQAYGVGSMLVQRLQRRANIDPTLDQCNGSGNAPVYNILCRFVWTWYILSVCVDVVYCVGLCGRGISCILCRFVWTWYIVSVCVDVVYHVYCVGLCGRGILCRFVWTWYIVSVCVDVVYCVSLYTPLVDVVHLCMFGLSRCR